jgi:hypothetical protein
MIKRVFSFFLILSFVAFAEGTIDYQKAYTNAGSSEKKLEIILKWSEHLDIKGDLTQSLNKMEKGRLLLKDIESPDLIMKTENQYWVLYKKWSRITDTRRAEIIAEKVERKNKIKEAELARQKAIKDKTSQIPSRFKTNISKYKSFVSGKRPLQRRIMHPLSMGHLNGFNTMLSIPELSSAYLLPADSNFILDYKFDLGVYKETSTNGFQQLVVDTTISRALIEISMPFSKLMRTDRTRPIDFRLGIPVIKWGTKPSFTFDKFDPKATLLTPSSTSVSLGDIYFDTKVTFFANFDYAIASSMRIKLPTGSTSDLAGTGGIDIGLSLLYSGVKLKHRWNVNLGMMKTDSADNFENLGAVDLKDILFFSSDYGFNLWRKHFLIVGLDYHENAYEGYTTLPVLQDPPTSLGMGLAMNFQRFKYYYGIKQGLNGASADTQLLFSFRMNY